MKARTCKLALELSAGDNIRMGGLLFTILKVRKVKDKTHIQARLPGGYSDITITLPSRFPIRVHR